ncbi:MFS transporter [Actinomadura graeca]|uniref:MFS transporter n=1 Tax=Actinomadura graeca TaxID=2750812 RepID=A0ABX8R3F0_9ACTN|nr:MFS transporter [Actinomadura graeca]QXJ25606.1 MFS transporter [Actinomadura graeca]
MTDVRPHRAGGRAPSGGPHRADRYRWTILGAATFTQAASGFFVQGIGAMGIHLQRGLDLSTAQLGFLLSATQIVPLAGLLVAGELLDRYSERWVVGTGTFVVALSLGLGSLAPGYVPLLGVLLIVGAGYSTVQPGGSKSVASWFAGSQRGLAMGIRQAGVPLGGVLAAALLPLLAASAGWRATFVAGGAAALLGAAVFLCLHRPPPSASDLPAGAGDDARAGERLASGLRTLREPAIVKIVLSGTALVSVHCGINVLTVLHLHETASLGAGAAALVLVAAQGAGVAGRICLAAWSDRSRFGRHGTVMTCMVATTAGTAALTTPLGHAPAAACPLFLWLGFFGIGWYGPWVAHVAESAPPGRTGSVLGLVMAVTQVAIVLVPPVLGLLRDVTHGFAPAWALLSVMTVAALALTARGTRPPARRRQGVPAR